MSAGAALARLLRREVPLTDDHSNRGRAMTQDADRSTGAQDVDRTTADGTTRDKYRDNDDMRAPLEGDQRTGTKSDTRGEARGDARENVGNNARGTDADPTGPEGNDKTRGKDD